MSSTKPSVSVVTPFYNTSRFLTECIESVLRQTHRDFEYILVDNQSTDGSSDIARDYARRDTRIRVLRTPRFFSQAQNYNYSLRQISGESRYCKMVQADDWIFERCIEEMVATFERHPSAGVVAGYLLAGGNVLGSGVYPTKVFMTGREACRYNLLDGIYMFGSQTSIMYRADLVRERPEFFVEGQLHYDSERVFEMLSKHDFAIIHQVLSYTRLDDASLTGTASRFTPEAMDRLLVVTRHGRNFLDEHEYVATVRHARAWVYGAMVRNLVGGVKGGTRRAYLQYQRKGLETIGDRIRPTLMVRHAAAALVGPLLRRLPGSVLRE
jgi:glycosyltransferase involved in cell wall biosynthesis